MNNAYWLNLFGFISLLAIGGLFRNSKPQKTEHPTVCTQSNKQTNAPHPFLCGKKMPIKSATVADLSTVNGISQQKASKIVAFFREQPHASVDDLQELAGIGPKMIARLHEYFF